MTERTPDFEAGGGSPLGQVMDDGTGGAIVTLVSTLSALAVMIPDARYARCLGP